MVLFSLLRSLTSFHCTVSLRKASLIVLALIIETVLGKLLGELLFKSNNSLDLVQGSTERLFVLEDGKRYFISDYLLDDVGYKGPVRRITNEILWAIPPQYGQPIINDVAPFKMQPQTPDLRKNNGSKHYAISSALDDVNKLSIWRNSSDLEKSLRLSLAENITWSLPRIFTNHDTCGLFNAMGKKRVYFVGDSFMRQIYSAMLLTTTGDFEHGAIKEKECSGEEQFADSNCRKYLEHKRSICNDSVTFHFVSTVSDSGYFTGKCSQDMCRSGSLIIWSEGSHPVFLDRMSRYGVYDPLAYYFRRILPSEICSQKLSNVFWISAHARPTLPGKYNVVDEVPSRVKQFNLDMRSYISRNECWNLNYINVYNMTESLIDRFLGHNLKDFGLTYDGVHYGMYVNLIKAQIILNSLSAVLSL